MIIKGKDPIAGSNEGITSTKITGTTTRQGLDVNVANYVKPTRKEQLTHTDMSGGKITFTNPMIGIEVYNDSSADTLTYTINSIDITVGPGKSDTGFYDSFTEVTIAGTSPSFRAIGLG